MSKMELKVEQTKTFCFFLIILCSTFATSALSMNFTIERSPFGMGTIVVGRGAIERGDAARFEATIRANPPSVPALMVTSPGGEVDASIELAKRIRENSFSIIAHQECASACAMVLFPAGEFSILTKGSLLGFHSCSTSGIRHELCNEAIAEFAVSNGFPFGTIEIFSDLYGPSEMKWMTEISARCFGFYRDVNDPKPINGGRKACVDGIIYTASADIKLRPFGPSFNCANAQSKVEHLFCLDRELMQSDSILGRVYDAVLTKSVNKYEEEIIRASQRRWITVRNTECKKLFSNQMDFSSTRDAALCLYKYNEDRIYYLLEAIYMTHQ